MPAKPYPNRENGRPHGPSSGPLPGEPELIAITHPTAALRARATGPASLAGADVGPLAEALAASGAVMKPLFGPSEDHLNLREAVAGMAPLVNAEGMSRYYKVECPEEKMEELAAKLRALPVIAAAYVKPAALPAVELNTMLPAVEDVPSVTPDFSGQQGYLGAAPGGVEATHSWTVPGGAGAGVRIIDVEGAWRYTHEDLTQNQGGVVGGTESTDIGWRNHGTAVMGEIGGDRNGFGITGISPDANFRSISIFGGMGSAGAIRRAADLLSPGDIILIELHRPGPLATGVGQQGFIAIEWWPDDYDAIRYAISRGIVVVEAAGNGAQDLDNPAYDQPAPGFPAGWSNPFRRGARDSGAILVGAGAPPPGTHGANHGPDRSRLDFSNYGAAVDAQGWGREVTTCGYGDLQGGGNEDLWYTNQFSGTSSASPILVGSIACIQGVRRARSLTPLTATEVRALLRSTGSPQTDAPGRPATQRIGNRPNIREMIARVAPVQTLTVPLHRYWNPLVGDHFYTTNWSELGNGRGGWRYEGVQCHVYPLRLPGTVPLYRYWNPTLGDHFYTTSFAELGHGARGWGYEGIQCYVRSGPGTGATALYR
ncbi:MAG TPA: S8 family serine peptidase, partial [Polyangia bacterium]|nr:S8 family serine peptidase [Polyangia bacterium]